MLAQMRPNKVKHKLDRGEVATVLMGEMTPDLVESFGPMGFDGIWIEGEHGPIDFANIRDLTRAADLWGMTSVARVNLNLPGVIYRTLDQGAQAIVVPHVNTVEQAKNIARASRYFPDGHRGIGGGRAHYYGVNVSRSESTLFVNDNILLIPMMEEVESIENLNGIASVEGVDVIHVAPGDLGQSMRNASQKDVWAVMDDIVPKIRAAGKWVGVGGNSPMETQRVKDLIGKGANMVTISSQALLMHSAKNFLGTVKG